MILSYIVMEHILLDERLKDLKALGEVVVIETA